MYRSALRSTPRAVRAIRPTTLTSFSARRLASTAPADKKRSTWKGTAARWGLAVAAVYFYNTSPIFADEVPVQVGPAPPHFSDADLPTIDAMIEEKRRQAAAAAPPPPPPKPTKIVEERQTTTTTKEEAKPAEPETGPTATEFEPGSPEALEQEATQQGAFNPETGEINWDCPCLGGMAHGPCGEEFKAAFSCFVYSKEEPKGMDCIEKFQHMQDCFRQYPEIYGAELADDEDEGVPAAVPPAAEESAAVADKAAEKAAEVEDKLVEKAVALEKEEETVVPKAATDATAANEGKEQ
ncbi:Oxidoreductase [Collariella sp. IMI 366227]|nr:Oxidoreductase [Collariella sp. IMI 366227]